MKILKIWHFLCLVFGFHSLNTLVKESHEVVYGKKNGSDPIQYLVCQPLAQLHPNKTIDLTKLRGDLYRYFNNSIHGFLRDMDPSLFGERILNQTKFGGYRILNSLFCFVANDEKELVQTSMFFSEKLMTFAIDIETFDFAAMKFSYDKIERLTVVRRDHPYSNCSRSNARFFCLNECFKRSFRLARYFYNSSETGLIHLNYNETNPTIEENERNCFGKCKKENCKMVQMTSNDYGKRIETQTFEAHPKLSDFWLQFIGLMCSFAGLSFRELTTIAIEFAQSKVKRRKIRIALFGAKWAILFLSLASFVCLCSRVVLKLTTEETEKGSTRIIIQPKHVHLALCVPIKEYFGHSFGEKTMTELESATDVALNDTLGDIYVTYQNKLFKSSYQVHSKVLFLNRARCFALTVQPNYQPIPSNPKLMIKFKKSFKGSLYLLSEEDDLNQQSFQHSNYFKRETFSIMKRIVKRSRSSSSKCVDYKEKYANCNSKWNCVDRCISRRFIEWHNRTTFGIFEGRPVIYKNWFSPTEWNSSSLMENAFENIKAYKNISHQCLGEMSGEEPCEEIKLEGTVPSNRLDSEPYEILIDLRFDVERPVEESASSYKLALDLVSIQGIFFGFTVLGLLKTVFYFAQSKMRIKNNKIVLLLIYLLCSIGFSWQTYHIFHLIVSGQLVITRYYELASSIQMPEMVFCLQIDQNLIDPNHQLTGQYLAKQTSELTTEGLFQNITYLNESNEWTPFNFDRVERFFYLDMKCFRIKIDQVYRRDQFHFSLKRQVLNVNFKLSPERRRPGVLKKERTVHFMTKSKETTEFSKMIYLKYECGFGCVEQSISHLASVYEYQDRFSFIREHFRSLQEENKGGDLQKQLLELQDNKHSLRTLNFPMEMGNTIENKLEVNENLFEQLYRSSAQKNRNKRTNLNYQRFVFIDNHLRRNYEHTSRPLDFTFYLDFLQKIVSSTNEQNFGKLILNLLNVLFIWLDLGVLDLHPVGLDFSVFLFGKIRQLLLFAYRWLKQIKLSIHKLLNPTRIA